MRHFILLIALAGFAYGEDVQRAADATPLVYYVDGKAFQQIVSPDGVRVTVSLEQDGKANWLTIYIENGSNKALNLLPAQIRLHQISPKDEELRMKLERELDKSVGRHVFWGQLGAGVAAALSRQVSTAVTTDAYGNSFTTVVNTPDYEAQARWLAWADAQAANGEAKKSSIHQDYLRATTVFPGSSFGGTLCFVRDKTLSAGTAKVTLGTTPYIFSLPPSGSAPAPTNQPRLPVLGQLSPVNESQADVAPEQADHASRPGVLGISGSNWTERGFSGVEIQNIAPESAAEAAGLRVGYVIIEVNGKQIHSTDDLANILAQSGPGARISISYMVRTNLGWMPGSTNTVLTDR